MRGDINTSIQRYEPDNDENIFCIESLHQDLIRLTGRECLSNKEGAVIRVYKLSIHTAYDDLRILLLCH